MSDTPETDAIADFYLAKAFSKNPEDRTVPCQFAARLERDLNRAIRERDEALHAIHTYKCETEAWELLQEARRERDEARAVAGAMADIAFKHLTSLLASTPHSKDAAHDEETQQVIAAIKQWKELKQ